MAINYGKFKKRISKQGRRAVAEYIRLEKEHKKAMKYTKTIPVWRELELAFARRQARRIRNRQNRLYRLIAQERLASTVERNLGLSKGTLYQRNYTYEGMRKNYNGNNSKS